MRRLSVVAAVLICAVTLLGAGALGLREDSQSAEATAEAAAAAVTVAAVGDIACQPPYTTTSTTCQHAAVARMVDASNPDQVWALGDEQYENAKLTQFQGSYDLSWGVLKPKTFPVPGNHEYQTTGATGYYKYYGARAHGAPGYYAFAAGNWRVYALNSNCAKISCSTEASWLTADLAANPTECVAAIMHHPRWSSGGEHGNNKSVNVLWTPLLRAKADLVLSGHDHDYERFARMGINGPTKSGMRELVSGLGGKNLYPLGTVRTGSQVRYDDGFGALFLTLDDGSYSWEFRTIGGALVDSGSDVCLS